MEAPFEAVGACFVEPADVVLGERVALVGGETPVGYDLLGIVDRVASAILETPLKDLAEVVLRL